MAAAAATATTLRRWAVTCVALASAAGCLQCGDQRRQLSSGESTALISPGYPAPYQPGTACRWTFVAPVNSKIVLSCSSFNLPASSDCSKARLSVSPSGDLTLSDAHLYCGSGSFSLTSDANRMVVVLRSLAQAGAAGSFYCTVAAVQQSTSTSKPCVCGAKKQTRIVGGHETGVNEYPMMAGLVDLEAYELKCGATIISTRHAITAAHCFANLATKDAALLVGDHDISTGTDTTHAALLLVDRLVPYPQYNSTSMLHDIGLIRVAGQIVYGTAVGPACLPFFYTYTDFQGVTVQALGWGTIDFGGPRSDVLQEVDLNVLSPQTCGQDQLSAEYQMCTYSPGKDACQADSGGPLLWQDPLSGRVQLVGIISFGSGCATETPSINTRVTAYLRWITSTTQDEFCAS